MPIRRTTFAALAVTASLVGGAPAAGASTIPTSWTTPSSWSMPTWPYGAAGAGAGRSIAGACGRPTTGEGQAGNGTVSNQVCQGAGLTFIGPSIGEIASVVGPTIIGPAFVGSTIVSTGNVAIGH